MRDMSDLVALNDRYAEAAVDVVEAMAERMLVTPGDWGVMVYSWIDMDAMSGTVYAELSHDAEPMTIGYAPFGVRPGELFN